MDNVFTSVKDKINVPLIANVPHSSIYIPPSLRNSFILNDNELQKELLLITDRYVDQLFSCVRDFGGLAVIYNISRLVVDPERFENDENEIMASRGMGAVYTHTSGGSPLRGLFTKSEREELINQFYRPYHHEIEASVQNLLDIFGRCMILDCHSFPSKPLLYELNQDPERPDVCIGTDPYHTPPDFIDSVERYFFNNNLTTARNMPFEGTYVPLKYYKKDKRVSACMIEVNRKLYMDELSGIKAGSFDSTKKIIAEMINLILKEYLGK